MNKKYTCSCGKTYDNKQSFAAHCSHCQIHLGYKPKDKFGSSRAWSKGKTKKDPVYGESIQKIAKASSERLKKLGSYNPLAIHSKNYKGNKKYRKQSKTRKQKYLSGELSPAKGVGRGKYSYFIFKNKKYLLRSTYEFIYALYLAHKNIEFEYETVRVSYINNRNETNIYISDFLINNNKIIEIKGYYDKNKISDAKKAFEKNNYKYKIIQEKDIKKIKEELSKFYQIDKLLKKIKDGHNNKNYFIFNFNENNYLQT